MAKGQQARGPPPPMGPTKTFKYGMPLYGLAWPEGATFYACGGGGSVSSGIKNRLVCAEAHGGALTDQTAEFLFGLDCPTRLVVSPGCKSVVFAMGKGGIQRLDVDARGKAPRFTEVTGVLAERLQAITVNVKALAFHPSGDLLALGGEDGSVVVYEWPSLRAKMELSGDRKLPEAVKDLDFVPPPPAASGSWRPSDRALAVVLDNGACVVLSVDRAGAQLCKVELSKGDFRNDKVMLVSSDDQLLIHHLPPGLESAHFSRVKCRAAAPAARGGPAGGDAAAAAATLVCLMNNRSGCHVALWELSGDGLLSMRATCRVSESPGACMDASADGALVAVGTSEGDVALVSCRPRLRVVKRFKKAHMIFTTNIAFNADGSYVLSASADASATLHSTALPPPTDFKKILVLAFFVLTLLLMCLLQVLRVLKQRGMTVAEIYALVGLRPRDEL